MTFTNTDNVITSVEIFVDEANRMAIDAAMDAIIATREGRAVPAVNEVQMMAHRTARAGEQVAHAVMGIQNAARIDP